jgi:hypothetical protein
MTLAFLHAQSAPSATTETTLYTVPALTKAVVNTYSICNRGATATTARVSLSIGGGATANTDYDIYDLLIPPNDTYKATCGYTLNAATVIRVYAGNGNLTFQCYGEEQS